MSIKTSIKDGTGSNKEVKVDISGEQNENSLWVNIAGTSPGLVIPIGPAVTGRRLLGEKSKFSKDGDLSTFEMNVSASLGSPQDFYIKAQASVDLVVTEFIIICLDGGIKLGNFYGQNSGLSNGLEITLKSDNISESLETLYTTNDADLFSSLGGFTFRGESGGDNAKSIRSFDPALIIRSTGTFGTSTSSDDFIRIRVQDNLSNITSFRAFVRGFVKPQGEL